MQNRISIFIFHLNINNRDRDPIESLSIVCKLILNHFHLKAFPFIPVVQGVRSKGLCAILQVSEGLLLKPRLAVP
ncbi:unnamed protein product, partial [Vitis vinifera]|uniref:Uncharacterized protein n=1 Tax=Vitis vinifera TaxID=29760 RepID=D7SR45_VITVI